MRSSISIVQRPLTKSIQERAVKKARGISLTVPVLGSSEQPPPLGKYLCFPPALRWTC